MQKKKWWEDVIQPLRIPAGWKMEWNKLQVMEPCSLLEGDAAWMDFTEDILYLYTIRKRKVHHIEETQRTGIDLGWYPECDPKGSYHLLMIQDDDWENPRKEFVSRSKSDVVAVIEQWLFEDLAGYHWMENGTVQ